MRIGRRELRLEPLAERLGERDLDRKDERIAQNEDAPLIRGLWAEVPILTDPLRIDRNVRY